MRSFSKKLAFVLAAAMVVTAFAPAAKAEAAKEMAINKSSQILYVNEGINHKGGEVAAPGKGNVSVYDFSVKNKPADWKTAYSFAWSSSDEDVVSVAKGGVATAVGVGKATVYCKVTEKATKEVTTLKTKVTVKANAYDVEITNADAWDGATVEVNEVVDLNRAMYDEDGNKTTKRGTLVTDYTKWVAEPAAGVEIDQKTGKFTFTEDAVAGEYKLSCYTYQSSKYTEATAKSDVVVVEFVNGGFEVDQTASNGFNLLFNKAADVKIADVTVNKIIKVGDSTGKLPQVVSNVAMSEDKKTASVSLFTNFENGATYEVSVKGYDEVASFVASYGIPVSMTISSNSNMQGGVAVYIGDTPTELTYKLFDAEGNDVTNTATGYVVFNAADLTTSDYFVNDNYIIIYKEGAQVAVNAEYHFYKNETDLDETVIKTTGYFVGVNKAANGLASVDIAAKYWGSSLTKLPVDLTGPYSKVDLEVKIKTTDSNDNGVVYSNGDQMQYAVNDVYPYVRYRSSNPDVFDINGDEIKLFTEGVSAVLVDLITFNDNGSENVNTVAAAYFTVSPKSVVSKVGFANGSSVVAGTVEGYDVEKLGINVQDQYGFTWGVQAVSYDANGNAVPQEDINGNPTFEEIKFSDDTVIDNGAIYFEERSGANGWQDKVVVDGTLLLEAMAAAGYVELDGDNWVVNGKNVTTLTKRVVVKDDAKNPAASDISFTFNVTLKKAVGNVMTSVVAEGTTSGNVARYNTSNQYDNAEQAKSVTFKVITKQNGIQTGQLALAGVKTSNTVASGAAIGDLYYTITRDTKDISSVVTDNGNSVTVNYSAEDATYGNVSYKIADKDLGAGSYIFTVYKVAKNNTTGKLYYAFVGSSNANVTCDAGSYTYGKRLAESVSTTDDATLRDCFEIYGLDGKKTTNGYSVDKTISENYVHVKSITFYEPLAGQNGAQALYTVPVNVSLKLQ